MHSIGTSVRTNGLAPLSFQGYEGVVVEPTPDENGVNVGYDVLVEIDNADQFGTGRFWFHTHELDAL